MGKHLSARDAAKFREEIINLIDRETARPNWNVEPQGAGINEFSSYPTLEKCLQAIRILPGLAPPGFAWIRFPTKGGAYNVQTMLNALKLMLEKKTGSRYAHLRQTEKLHRLYLIVYYN